MTENMIETCLSKFFRFFQFLKIIAFRARGMAMVYFGPCILEIMMTSSVNIEVQTKNGSWWGIYLGIPNDTQLIQSEFKNAVKSPMCFRGCVRAVDQKTGEILNSN